MRLRLSIAALSLTALVASTPARALEREVVVDGGGPRPWVRMASTAGLRTGAGRWGLQDLVLQDAAYRAGPDTAMLLHLDSVPFIDATGTYRSGQEAGVVSIREKMLGDGAAAFHGGTTALVLSGPPLLGDGDFTIEFWLYPVNLVDGERVLSWSADRWTGARIQTQRLTAAVRGRTLLWQLDGVFLQDARRELPGLTHLVPRTWSHHMLRYDSRSGLLEYLVGGLPEAVGYLTDSGRDGGTPLSMLSDTPGRLVIGEPFTGLLDELRVSHRLEEDPQLTMYPTAAGTAVTEPLDLGHPGSRVTLIEAVRSEPGSTAVLFFYRVSDSPLLSDARAWTPFEPGAALSSTPGRYVQIKAELYSDRNQSPSLSRLRVVYEPDIPPYPPARVTAEAGDGTVTVRWTPVLQDDLAGYLIYYGDAPGRYRGTDSMQGPSPVDVGRSSIVTLTGLENGKLYYFSVVSYDRSYPAQQSEFSAEVAARPRPASRPAERVP